jgi:hypothetical protein
MDMDTTESSTDHLHTIFLLPISEFYPQHSRVGNVPEEQVLRSEVAATGFLGEPCPKLTYLGLQTWDC